MKILVVYEQNGYNFRNRYSAVATVLISIATILTKQGHTVLLNDSVFDDLVVEKCRVNKVALVNRFYFRSWIRFFPSVIREMFKDIIHFVGQYFLFLKLSKLSKPDVILSWTTYGGTYCVDLSKKWNVPLISVFDNPISDEYLFLKGFKPFFSNWIVKCEKKCIENSQSIIVYSPAVKDFVLSTFRCQSNFFLKSFYDIHRTSNITCDSSHLKKSNVKILYIGSFFNWHNLEILIKAFETISKTIDGIELVLIGNGPEYERINFLVSAMDCSSQISMPGMLDNAELNEIISTAHVGVIPGARWYQAPVKLYQYSSQGLAVVSIRTPTISFITQRDPGFALFNNQIELEKALLHLCEDNDMLDRTAISARNYYNTELSADGYFEFFNDLLRDVG